MLTLLLFACLLTCFVALSLHPPTPTPSPSGLGVISGATYILVVVAVNLVGYAVGVSGLTHILDKAASWEGLRVLLGSFYFLCWGVVFMAFLRRNGFSSNT